MDKIPSKYQPGWLMNLDGRTAICQELRRRYHHVVSDLGGAESLSYAKSSLVERLLWLEHWLQTQEQKMAEGAEIDSGRYSAAVNSLKGIIAVLGVDRKARDITLGDYIKEQGAA